MSPHLSCGCLKRSTARAAGRLTSPVSCSLRTENDMGGAGEQDHNMAPSWSTHHSCCSVQSFLGSNSLCIDSKYSSAVLWCGVQNAWFASMVCLSRYRQNAHVITMTSLKRHTCILQWCSHDHNDVTNTVQGVQVGAHYSVCKGLRWLYSGIILRIIGIIKELSKNEMKLLCSCPRGLINKIIRSESLRWSTAATVSTVATASLGTEAICKCWFKLQQSMIWECPIQSMPCTLWIIIII